MIQGCDYSFTVPPLQVLTDHGAQFVGRYVSGRQDLKDLTAGEAQSLIAAGLSIIVYGESDVDRPQLGYQAGRDDAQAFRAQANSVGLPNNRPIFYSVDFDATPDQLPIIRAYFDGIRDVEGNRPVGVYGSYAVCKYLHQLGRVQFMAQTLAWSNGQWYAPAQVRQYAINVSWGRVAVDLIEATSQDYGQWPAPQPAPTPPERETMGATAGTFTPDVRQHTIPFTVGASSATQARAWFRLRAAWGSLESVRIVFEDDHANPTGQQLLPELGDNTSEAFEIPSGTTGINVDWQDEHPASDAQGSLVAVGWSIEFTTK